MDRFEHLFKQALEQDCEILLVVAGWDGLTTHQGTFQRLFYRAIELNVAVRLRIYTDDVNNPREEKFYDVDPNEAYAITVGDLNAEDENFPSFASTRLFVDKFDIIHSAKVIQAIRKRLANEHTYQRNVYKGCDYNRRGYLCGIDGCLEGLRNSVLLVAHRSHKHYEFKNEEGRKATLNCRYCEKSFSRKDARDRYEKICPKNPAILRDLKLKVLSAPKRRYLTIEEVPSGSNNGPKVYDQLNAENAKLLPRIDPADAVIYHHEKYCRYPGCEYLIRHDRIIKIDTKNKKIKTIANEKCPAKYRKPSIATFTPFTLEPLQ